MENNLRLLRDCYIKNCEMEMKTLNKLREKWINNSVILLDNYKNKIIKKKEYIEEIKKLDDKYYKSLEFIKSGNCKINKCNELTKIQLDFLSKRINTKPKDKYNINDFIKLTRLNTNTILSSLIKHK
jgi:nicotinate-nucleotide pyrophosphorylase